MVEDPEAVDRAQEAANCGPRLGADGGETERGRTRQQVERIGSDPEAFETFYREHIEAIQRFVARRVDDPYLAADLTADVFMAAIESAHTYRPWRASPIGWLYGVAHNVVAAERRRQARELRATGRLSGRRLLEADDLARLEERIDAEARARELYLAMDRLPDSERAVLELTALEGLTVSEAAQALRITAVAARVRLHRARRKLRDQLTPSVVDARTEEAEALS